MAAARALATAFAAHNISLVYGGGTRGLMGELARTLVSLRGPDSVHGIIPSALIAVEHSDRDRPSDPTTNNSISPSNQAIYGRTTIVQDMHTRKRFMASEVLAGGPGSGFVALSGGFGTLEELMEMTTWNQLGIHACGVVVFNVEGYWDGLLQWVMEAVRAGFIVGGNAGILVQARDAEEVVWMLRAYRVSEQRLRLDWSLG